MNRTPYEPARARQLRRLLKVVVGLGAVMVGYAAGLLILRDADAVVVLVVLVVPALLMLGLGGRALSVLGSGAGAERVWVTATAAATILVGVLLSRTGPGLLVGVAGILLLLFAVLPARDSGHSEPDEPDAG